ncbi:MAG: hypothetical protein OES38_18340, partial [Gammaproteobacteria bacterium]|nr:hypothetical protein [Gammaproteobacteria bacterium]
SDPVSVASAPQPGDSGSQPAQASGPVDAQPPNTPLSRSSGHYQPEGDFDPMLVMALGDFSDEEIARYNDLHILPFNKAVDRDCEEQPHPNFMDRSYTVCKTVREFPEHPYTELDTKALMELAVHDEVAALLLGRRVKQEEERLYWYLRAAALSEKSGPLMALAANRYSSVHTLKPVDGQLRAVEQLDNIAMRIALDTVARKMGDPRANPGQWQRKLRRVAAGKADAYLTQADALVAEFLATMAQTQREITGSIQVQEIIDNA